MGSSGEDLAKIFENAKTSEEQLFKLLEIGRSKGFETFLNRKLIWPFLLDLKLDPLGDSGSGIFDWKETMDHNSPDYEQLQKDAERALSSMKTFQDITKFHLRKRQEAVLSVLDTFFAKNRDLRYIQGFHDVASIFLIVYGNNTGYYMMEKAGRVYFKDFLQFQFAEIGLAISEMVYDLVVRCDPDFEKIFAVYETKFLIFILPWILTWFSHVFSSVKIISRIWDYILCTGPHGVIYLTAAVIVSTKERLIKECDQFDEPSIQCFYQNMAKNQDIDIEVAIEQAIKMETEMAVPKKMQYEKLSGYEKLQETSIFRLENFYKTIQIHKKFHLFLKSREAKKSLLRTTAAVAGVGLLILGVGFAAYKFSKGEIPLKFIKGGQL